MHKKRAAEFHEKATEAANKGHTPQALICEVQHLSYPNVVVIKIFTMSSTLAAKLECYLQNL